MSSADLPPRLVDPNQRGAVPPEEAEDDAEFGAYEAEARLLALHRAQQRAMLVGDAADASQSMPTFDDGEMYEECEEAEEEVEEPSSSGLVGYPPAVGVAGASAQAAHAGAAKDEAPRSASLFPPTNTKAAAAQPAGPQRTALTVKARVKVRTGSAKPRPKNGGLPSPRSGKKTAADDGTTTSAAAVAKPRRKRKERKKVLNCTLSRYALVRELAAEFGFVIEDDDEVEKFGFNMIWADTVLPLQKLARLANWQRFNHFPSMHLLCRKGHLGLTLGRMRRAFPDDYSFFPRTWALRSERSQFAKHFSQQATTRKTYIMKPNAGCQGKGIILSRDPLNSVEDGENYVVQEYMSKPLLIDGKKFDLRVYVLVTSVRHLSMMVYFDGLVRICADAYQKPTDSNLANTCIHLTNYAVNKHSENFVFNQDAANSTVGNKRDFKFLNEWLAAQGHDVAAFWGGIDDAIVKAVIAALPRLQHVYSSVFPHSNDGYTCFEVLGFDVLVDEKLRPWLLEVNHTPSFHTDTPLDHRIKHGLLHEVWSIIRVGPNDKARHLARERALRARRLGAGGMSASATTMPALDVNNINAGDSPAGSAPAVDPLAADVVDPHAVIRQEDTRLRNFRRVFPSPNPLTQAKYELLIRGSKDASEDKTTASQEARNQEARAERDKREARLEAERMLMPQGARGGGGANGNTAAGVSASPPSAATQQSPSVDASAAAASASGTFAASTKQWATQLRSSGPPPLPPPSTGHMSAGEHPPPGSAEGSASRGRSQQQPGASSSSTPSSASSGAHHHAMSAPPVRVPRDHPLTPTGPSTPPSAATSSSAHANGPRPHQQTSSGGGAAASASRPKPPPTDPRAMRDRLHEQMEKHRRRMVLGPRLSVFQLRDTQLDSMTAPEHQQQQQPPPAEAATRSPPPPIPGATSNGATARGFAAPPSARAEKAAPPPLLPATTFAPQQHPAQYQRSGPPAGNGSARIPLPIPSPSSGRNGGTTTMNTNTAAAADGGGGGGGVAMSAAMLQSHWLYHYDS